jgi:hypothetical protein
LPNDSASLGDINNYFWIKETNYPFIYGGMAFLFTALIVAIIPILPLLIKRKV